jgi:hypothetical protein
LFDLIESHDEQLIAFPGPHRTIAPAAARAWCEFVAYDLKTDVSAARPSGAVTRQAR